MADFASIPWARTAAVDFQSLADLGKSYHAARQQGVRDSLASQVDVNNPMSLADLAKRHAQAGDMQGAAQAATLYKSLSATDTTDDIKEWKLAQGQGYKGTLQDWIVGNKRAGATNVNVNTGEKEYDKTLGKASAERFLEYQKGAQAATGEIATLDVLDKLTNDPSFYSGVGAERFALPLKQIISRMGGDPNAAASMETFRALSNKSVLDSMGGSLGTGFSNADRDFVVGQVANLGNTPEGNRQLIALHKKVGQRKQVLGKMSREYASKHGGRLDAGFDKELSEYAEKNPLFPQAANNDGWKDLGNGVRIREKR